MKVLTIANVKKVNQSVFDIVPELASKVESEYNAEVEKALTTTENNEYLTENQQNKVNEGKKQVQDFAKNIVNKVNKTYKANRIDLLNEIFADNRTIQRITIATDWKSMYDGNQCRAKVTVLYDDYTTETYTSTRTNGGNYDKESTATKGALNQINALLKELFIKADEAIKAGKSYRDYIGYGVTYYETLPFFDGGVGFNCHQHVLEKLGYTFKHLHWTKRTDVYEFTKGDN